MIITLVTLQSQILSQIFCKHPTPFQAKPRLVKPCFITWPWLTCPNHSHLELDWFILHDGAITLLKRQCDTVTWSVSVLMQQSKCCFACLALSRKIHKAANAAQKRRCQLRNAIGPVLQIASSDQPSCQLQAAVFWMQLQEVLQLQKPAVFLGQVLWNWINQQNYGCEATKLVAIKYGVKSCRVSF